MEKFTEDVSKSKGGTGLGGLGLGLGLDINLDLSGVRTLVDTLGDALATTGGVAGDLIAKVVESVRRLGVEDLKNWVQQGGAQAQELYGQLVSKLQEAAGRGEEEARKLLYTLGENVESTGEKMQDVASEEGRGITH